jgi:hypothetical protein
MQKIDQKMIIQMKKIQIQMMITMMKMITIDMNQKEENKIKEKREKIVMTKKK